MLEVQQRTGQKNILLQKRIQTLADVAEYRDVIIGELRAMSVDGGPPINQKLEVRGEVVAIYGSEVEFAESPCEEEYGDTRSAVRVGQSVQSSRRSVGHVRGQVATVWDRQRGAGFCAAQDFARWARRIGEGAGWTCHQKSLNQIKIESFGISFNLSVRPDKKRLLFLLAREDFLSSFSSYTITSITQLSRIIFYSLASLVFLEKDRTGKLTFKTF
jgi:hypothetical protein